MTEPAITLDPAVVLARVGSSTAVYVPSSRELLELSAVSVAVLDRLADGREPLGGRRDAELVDQLRHLGVLTTSPGVDGGRPRDGAGLGPATPTTSDRAAVAGLEAVPDRPSTATAGGTTTVLGPYAALNHCFTVRLDDSALADELRHVLGDLETSRVDDPVVYVVEPGDDGRLTLRRSGSEVAVGDPVHVLAMLLWDLNREAVASVVDEIVLHAGAVTRGDRAIALPGAQEFGKTTLVTAMVRAGAGYLSDELAALSTSGPPVVRPYAKALSIDPGSWTLFPELAPPPRRADLSPNQWLLRADDVRPGAAVQQPVPLMAVVFPTYHPSSQAAAYRLEPLEALRRLAECTFGFHEHPEVLLPLLAPIAESVPAWALDVGDGVTDAVDAIDGIVDRSLSGAGC